MFIINFFTNGTERAEAQTTAPGAWKWRAEVCYYYPQGPGKKGGFREIHKINPSEEYQKRLPETVRGKAGAEQAEARLSEDHPGGTKLMPGGCRGSFELELKRVGPGRKRLHFLGDQETCSKTWPGPRGGR